jgi:hypothetical protein
MDFKNILRLVLGVLLPVIFVALKTLYPDFPLSQDTFVMLVIWAVGLLIGGWNLKIVVERFKTYGTIK